MAAFRPDWQAAAKNNNDQASNALRVLGLIICSLHSSPPWAAITAKAKRLIGLFLPSTDWEDDGARTCVCNAFCWLYPLWAPWQI